MKNVDSSHGNGKRHSRHFFPENLPVRVMQILVDLGVFGIATVAAYLVRFEGALPHQSYKQMILLVPYLAITRLIANVVFGVYRIVWRYVGLRETIRFLRAVVSVSVILLAIRLFYPTHNEYFKVPIGIILLEGTLSFVGLTGTRFLRRIIYEQKQRGAGRAAPVRVPISTLLVGAGEAGLAIAKQTTGRPDLGFRVVGYVDDDPAKAGMEIHGHRILGTLHDFNDVLAETRARQVIITTARIPSPAILDVMDRCRPLGIDVRIVPGLYELLGSNIQPTMAREVRIEDLLSREPIPPSMSMAELTRTYQGKRVLVTGAGGSIGSELCRQLALMEPDCLLLLERDENNLFEIERELVSRERSVRCVPILADVADREALATIFHDYRPECVFHAAAFKHVPMMERFPAAAVQNNILGTRGLTELAIEYEVESFLMISTDKAVNPTSVMGATKRLAELIVQRSARVCDTHFSCVRFGNVLGSRGSVVGIFREQIQRGGPVTVTDPEATRYFMTIPEAVNLVLQAATLGDRGEVFLLDMGTPVRIIDLARQMIRLSGKTEMDVPITITGSRPGEKLFEELRTDGEDVAPTELRKIFRCAPTLLDDRRMDALLTRLEQLAQARDHKGVRNALLEMDIGYRETPPRPARVAEALAL